MTSINISLKTNTQVSFIHNINISKHKKLQMSYWITNLTKKKNTKEIYNLEN